MKRIVIRWQKNLIIDCFVAWNTYKMSVQHKMLLQAQVVRRICRVQLRTVYTAWLSRLRESQKMELARNFTSVRKDADALYAELQQKLETYVDGKFSELAVCLFCVTFLVACPLVKCECLGMTACGCFVDVGCTGCQT